MKVVQDLLGKAKKKIKGSALRSYELLSEQKDSKEDAEDGICKIGFFSAIGIGR